MLPSASMHPQTASILSFLLTQHVGTTGCTAQHCHFPAARPSRQQIANGPKILVGTPSKTLPLTCPALARLALLLDAGLPVRHCTWTWCSERLYHRDPERVARWWVGSRGQQGRHTLHRKHVRPNLTQSNRVLGQSWASPGPMLLRRPMLGPMLGPTRAHRPSAGPNASSAVGRRAVHLLGCIMALGLLGEGTGTGWASEE
ncbi:hypothetical protein N431DRAFT_55684 [Stipitochalara longipes BDJ]|nr:hypothetical protein N431DRAFT_55684 [Stipitochalara longipes BDJ]